MPDRRRCFRAGEPQGSPHRHDDGPRLRSRPRPPSRLTLPRNPSTWQGRSSSEEVWRYSQNFIDGLLQTPEYAAAFLELGPKATEQSVKQQVEFRRARQDRVNREDSPTKLRVVLDEAALRRKVGGTDATRDQIRHLVELAERPSITIQVVPFDAGAYPGMQSPFTCCGSPSDSTTCMPSTWRTSAARSRWSVPLTSSTTSGSSSG
ncbi:DUF5753 domain-containing protein [Saccharopolyspora sp. ASAGF58]|uniref:DUF5753 domain-containing protein n=1 Tax=Saccharopolyspora sp. ASAGF58 TaxID=2719023 RepID=UPI00353005AB